MFTTPLLLLAAALTPAAAAPSCGRADPHPQGPTLPQTGTSNDLPLPPSHLTLKHIALGFGIQNYTCAHPGATAAATGALAMLYDITDLYPGQGPSSLAPQDFANLPAHALWSHRVPLNLTPSRSGRAGPGALGASQTRPFTPETPLRLDGALPPLPFLGHHFFDSRGVPTFVLDGGKINLPTAKLDAVAAPGDADAGPEGTGAVGWLYLGPKEGAHGAKYVYRVLTAGGVSHGCRNATGDDSTSYTATYWFYG
ncbi:malate dehydrogenase [Hirsutella rhossiliensis]|uniref:Malate dehydrogenase n=1 Tax=Hirsutella rhossiliensis TaxID=111463 RepID=A0A9P8MSV4_9HYPO|nr:malate dehydrogenase [Hirsutella rhossiliensis]KAH0959606.1 malate dehydrogenase [Hirsutella rhossiliensis]